MFITAVLTAVVMLGVGEVRGQGTLPVIWDQRDMPAVLDAHEEAVAGVYWFDQLAEKHYLFVTGWGTNPVTGATFIATYKYDIEGTTPELRRATGMPALFPPNGNPAAGKSAKPTAIDVDPDTGEVYVVGWATNPGAGRTDTDYIILKYDSGLLPDGSWPMQPPYDQAGVRHYDAGGNDRGVDIKIATPGAAQQFGKRLFITGTSWGGQTGNDIVTMRLDPTSGAMVWAQEHRFDGFEGVDEAVRLVWAYFAELDGSTGAHPIVAGTSFGGVDHGTDYVALLYNGATGSLWERWPWIDIRQPTGVRRYDGPNQQDDICADMVGSATPAGHRGVGARLVLCGSVTPTSIGLLDDKDYGVWCLVTAFGSTPWTRTWNGGDAPSQDVATSLATTGGTGSEIAWITGNVRQDGVYDIGTIAIQVNTLPNSPGGTLLGEHIAGFPALESRPVMMTGGGGPYVATWHFVPYQDPMFTFLVLRYDLGPMRIGAMGFFGGEGYDNRPSAIWSVSAPGNGYGLYVTGRSGSSMFGLDYMTVRFGQ